MALFGCGQGAELGSSPAPDGALIVAADAAVAPVDVAEVAFEVKEDALEAKEDASEVKEDASEVKEDAFEVKDALLDATAELPETAVTDAQSITPTAATLPIALNTQLQGLSGILKVKVMPAALFLSGKIAESPDTLDLFGGPLPALPLQLQAELPAGDWMPFAMVLGNAGPAAAALSCGSAGTKIIHVSPEQVAAGALLPTVQLQLNAVVGNFDTQKICGIAIAPVLTQLSWTATPPTQWGGAHLLQGSSQGDKLWVAGSQDGLVSFDLPPPPAPLPAKLAGWTVHGGAFCNRLLQHAGRVYCSSRANYLQVFTLDLAQPVQTPTKVTLQAPSEGLTVRGDTLWVASHSGGLVPRQATPPYGPVAAKMTSTLQDAWDVVPVGPDALVVADGRFGLKVLQVDLAGQWTQTAALALPGTCIAVQLAGTTALVSALGGGLHAVDVSVPSVPKLLATLQYPGVAVGAALLPEGLVLAGGHHVLATAWPPPPNVPWMPRKLLPTLGYALDAVPGPPGQVRTAEFLGVRQWQWGVLPNAKVPLLWTVPTVTSKVSKIGDKLVVQVPIANLGGQPLHVGPIVVNENPGAQPVITIVPGQWVVQPGQTLQLAVPLTKTVKGATAHQIHLYSDDPDGQTPVSWLETTWLVAGDKLPPLVYSEATGKMVSVTEHFAGKVGVLMVGAQSCPVAALALAALSADVQAQLATGKVAALGINPWDKPALTPEVAAIATTFPMLYAPMTTSDGHDASEVLDQLLGQPAVTGPPMPIVYVVDKKGVIVLAKWGYDPGLVLGAVQQALD